ncbi:MAG: hypothetical protein IKT23_01220 [Clostridia bacterium]|nr:hypothetical protein [Clostridia bacterium]
MVYINRTDSSDVLEEILVLNAISLTAARMARRLAALVKHGQYRKGGTHIGKNERNG